MMESDNLIKKRIENINNKIRLAAQKSERDFSEIKLVLVTKRQPIERIYSALKNGIEYIGENRIQEIEEKLPLLKNKIKEFHFIGHLQSNKINKLLALRPKLIHSLDKYTTIEKMNNHLIELNLIQDILIQVNTSFEINKSGIEPDKTVDFCNSLIKFKNIRIKGLMTIGKLTDNRNEIRAGFKLLKELFDTLKDVTLENMEMKYLSMGMSSDFDIAIEEGANIIRIGSAILGARKN